MVEPGLANVLDKLLVGSVSQSTQTDTHETSRDHATGRKRTLHVVAPVQYRFTRNGDYQGTGGPAAHGGKLDLQATNSMPGRTGRTATPAYGIIGGLGWPGCVFE